MRDNLIFFGVTEEQDGDENLNNKFYGAVSFNTFTAIIRCRRMPKARKAISNDRPRNVVATFADNADVRRILSGAKFIKGRSAPLYINHQ